MKGGILKKSAAFVLALVIITGCITPLACAKSGALNWMSAVKDDTLITDVNIPGTHDSATQYTAFAIKARTQSKSIPEQLNIGARLFDIRLTVKDGELVLCHGIIDCRKGSGFGAPVLTFKELSEGCIKFLKDNPGECMVFFIKQERGNSEDFETLLQERYKAELDRWYIKNDVPTVGELRGKIYVINRYSDGAKSDESNGLNLTNFPVMSDNEGSFLSADLNSFETGKKTAVYTAQDRYKYGKEDKWEKAVLPALEYKKPKGQLHLNFLSTASGISPEISAEYVNGKFEEYKLKEGKAYGFIFFDFADEGLMKKVYSSNAYISSGEPAPGVAAAVPEAENGKIPFITRFWNWIISIFK